MRVAPSAPHLSGRMFVGMTRPQTRTYGVVTPSTRQPLLEAMLRAFAWLVSNVVSMLATIFNRPTRDWHTAESEETQLPTSNDLTQETCQAAPTGLTSGSGPSAASPAKAGVQSARIARSQQGTALSPLVPTNVGTQGGRRTLSRLAASGLHPQPNGSWIPTLILNLAKDVGTSGSCCAAPA